MRSRGPSGAVMWGVCAAAMTYGFIMIGQTNRQNNAERSIERRNQMAMVPFLQAESDLDWLAKRDKVLAREAKIMEGVEGWEVGQSTYLTKDRWVPEPPFRLQKWYKK